MIPLIEESLKRMRLFDNLHGLISIREYGIVTVRKTPVLRGGK